MNRMRDLARRAAETTNTRLAEREAELINDTTIDWESFRPQLGEQEYEQLMQQVAHATQHNESIGSVLQRLRELGQEGIAVAERVRGLMPL